MRVPTFGTGPLMSLAFTGKDGSLVTSSWREEVKLWDADREARL